MPQLPIQKLEGPGEKQVLAKGRKGPAQGAVWESWQELGDFSRGELGPRADPALRMGNGWERAASSSGPCD